MTLLRWLDARWAARSQRRAPQLLDIPLRPMPERYLTNLHEKGKR